MPSENGISLLVLVPDCGNAAVAVYFLPRRRADRRFPCPGCTRISAGALLGQGWGSCKAAGAPQFGGNGQQGRDSQPEAELGLAPRWPPRCPGSLGSPLSPSQRDQLGSPWGRWKVLLLGRHCTQQHPAAPSSCPRRVLREGLPCRSRQDPRPLASVHYRWSLSSCWSCRKRQHESAAMDFFLTGADPSGLLFITCSRRSYCSYSKSFYNDLSL